VDASFSLLLVATLTKAAALAAVFWWWRSGGPTGLGWWVAAMAVFTFKSFRWLLVVWFPVFWDWELPGMIGEDIGLMETEWTLMAILLAVGARKVFRHWATDEEAVDLHA
jgi:hypothetical protein